MARNATAAKGDPGTMNVIALPKPKKPSRWENVLDTDGRPIPGFKRYRVTGVIFYRESFKKLGIPELFRSTEQTTIGRARSAAKVMVSQHVNHFRGIQDNSIYALRSRVMFREVADDVLARLTPTRRVRTQENHRFFITQLIEAFGREEINQVTARAFEEFIANLRKTNTNRTTFADYAKHMNLIMRHAYNERKCTHLITFKNPDRQKAKPGRLYTREETQALWNVMSENLRDQFALSLTCMMRLREVLFLTWDRVDLETGKITLRPEDVKTGSKTGKGRTFKMSDLALERLRVRVKRQKPRSRFVFASPKNKERPINQNKTAWTNAKEKAGITGVATWHSLRHTGITRALLESNMPPMRVSEYAGVSISTIQRIYLHSKAEDTKDVAESVKI